MGERFDILSAIECKKRGGEVSAAGVAAFVSGYSHGEIPDYQASAFLMACVLRGMSEAEAVALTEAIWRSGDTLAFPGLGRPLVDKHSTGGVGDKVTPIFVALAAACGAACCKMSGRGLGHTGGTIDKLESIPGFRTSIPSDALASQMADVSAAIIGQSGKLAPADKKLYALRDVTGTVASVPLIVASVMGKKLAGGAQFIVLDVKVGKGAFFRELDDAREFSRLAVAVGGRFGRRVRCVLTRMDAPLGYAVGNALEIAEVLDALAGSGAPGGEGGARGLTDLLEVTCELAAHALYLAGLAQSEEAGREIARARIADKSASRAFSRIVAAQGGSLDAFRERMESASGRERVLISAPAGGIVAGIDALSIGEAARVLGAGRFKLADGIDPLAGIVLKKKPGDVVEKGEPWAVCHFDPAHASVRAHLGTNFEEVAETLSSILSTAIEIIQDVPSGRVDRTAQEAVSPLIETIG